MERQGTTALAPQHYDFELGEQQLSASADSTYGSKLNKQQVRQEAVPFQVPGTGLETLPVSREAHHESPTAGFIEFAAGKVVSLLENRAATKDERKQTRAEQYEAAMGKLRDIGRNTLITATEVGIITASVTYLKVGASVDGFTKGLQFVHQKFTEIRVNAQTRRDERITRIRNQDHELANRMNYMHDQQTEANRMNDYYDDHTEAIHNNYMYDQETEASEMNDEFDEDRRQEAAAKAERARQAKAERRERNRERFEKARNKTQEYGKKAGRFGKRLGKAALRFAKRSGRAIASGARAAAASWQQA